MTLPRNRLPAAMLGVLLPALLAAQASAQDKEAMIEAALSAAPPHIAESATVKDMTGEVLRPGEGAYTCFPGMPKGAGPMCLDEEWARWMDALMKKGEYQPRQVGLAYMLAGDMPDGGASNIDPFATSATSDNQWVVEGPHLMVLVPDPAALDAITTDPEAGVPYVMWHGTPYAHIMVPVADRPQ